MSEITMQEVQSAVGELRKSIEKYGADSSDFKTKSEKIETDLKTFDDTNQKLVQELEQEKKGSVERDERIQTLELEMAKGGASSGLNFKESDEYKALQAYCIGGEKGLHALDDVDIKTLRTDVDTGAGYLTSTELDDAILKPITEISAMRSVCRVKTVSKKVLDTTVRNGIPTATYEGEAQAGDDSQSSYKQETTNAFRQTVTVPYTLDMLMDSNWDLESEIMGDVGESFAQNEGNRFLLGSGAKEPEGILVEPTIAAGSRVSAGSGVISADDLILLTGDLKIGYNAMFSFNRQTLAFLRTLKDTAGAYVWHAGSHDGGMGGSVPNTIAGEQYIVMQDMPSIAVGNLPVIYGDFRKTYTIIDRTGLVIIRDEVTKKRQAIIEMTFHRYNGGMVVLPEATKSLKVKA